MDAVFTFLALTLALVAAIAAATLIYNSLGDVERLSEHLNHYEYVNSDLRGENYLLKKQVAQYQADLLNLNKQLRELSDECLILSGRLEEDYGLDLNEDYILSEETVDQIAEASGVAPEHVVVVKQEVEHEAQ